MLLSRESVNKGTKRMNSLALPPVTRPYRKNRYLQVLHNTLALNSYLGLFALCKKKFLVYAQGAHKLVD